MINTTDTGPKTPSGTLKVGGLNRRQRTLITTAFIAFLLISVILGGLLLSNERITTNLEARNQAPSVSHPFGTDWLGRDMLTRSIKGLTLSIFVGLIAAAISTVIAMVLGIAAATMGKRVDAVVTWLVDLFMSIPHLVSLILIAVAAGGGMRGVVVGVAVTHWPSLTRVVRGEVLQLRSTEYVQISRRMGKSRWWIALQHIVPHLIPQLLVGLILLFSHAILHEAAISFLGFGLSPHQPAIGIILSESMRYLSVGMWWLAFFPGLSLLIIVRLFDTLGDNLRKLMDPYSAHS